MTWKKVSGIHTLFGSVIVRYFNWPEREKELFRKKKSFPCHFSFHVWIGEPGVEPLLPECQLAAVSGNDDDEDDVGNDDHDGDGDDVQCHMVTVSGYN